MNTEDTPSEYKSINRESSARGGKTEDEWLYELERYYNAGWTEKDLLTAIMIAQRKTRKNTEIIKYVVVIYVVIILIVGLITAFNS